MKLIATTILLGAALGLGACSPVIKCDADGFIVIPQGKDAQVPSEWVSRNATLAIRRMNAVTGYGNGEYYTRESMEKAEGCP